MVFRRRRWRVLAITLISLVVVAVSWTSAREPADTPPRKNRQKPRVQLALLLDTSNSMDGLIDQAKTQLWKIVGEFAKTKLAGKSPKLEVALYEYGNDNNGYRSGRLQRHNRRRRC